MFIYLFRMQTQDGNVITVFLSLGSKAILYGSL